VKISIDGGKKKEHEFTKYFDQKY